MLFHGGALTGGYLGVDAFFVLSGFLITSLILHEICNEGQLNRSRFWARRARRLLPALFLMLFAVCAYAGLFAQQSELDRIRGDALATVFYVANWHAIFSGHGYWELFQAPSPLEHMWSLAIEEQFYVIWPLVVVAIAAIITRRRNQHTNPAPPVFAIAVIAGISSTIWCSVLFRADDVSRAYLGTDTRVGSILFGSAFAAWTVWKGPVRRHTSRIALEILAIIATIGVALAWTRLNGQDLLLYRGGLLLSGLGILTIIAAVAHPTKGPLHKILAWKPFVAIGLISYGLYLWHWPLYVLLNEQRTGLNGTPLLTLRIAASFAVALTSYYLIEKPIRHHPLPKKLNIIIIPLTITALISTIYLTTANATTNQPTTGDPFIVSSDGTNPDLTASGKAADQLGNKKVLIVGDSVGVNVGSAATKLAQGTSTSVAAGAVPGCVLENGTGGYRATSNGRSFVVQELRECTGAWLSAAEQFKPSTTVIIYGTGGSFLDVELDGRWQTACDVGYQNWYDSQLRSAISSSQSEGSSEVFLVKLPTPTADFLPADAASRIGCINNVHARVTSSTPGVTLLDLNALVCPDGACLASQNGATLRTDGLHFDEGASSEWVSQWLLSEIGATGG
jgi:peptidoglycan/LPS O-acetylase OafA/YrhL